MKNSLKCLVMNRSHISTISTSKHSKNISKGHQQTMVLMKFTIQIRILKYKKKRSLAFSHRLVIKKTRRKIFW